MADPVGFDEVRSNPPLLSPFTTSLAVLYTWLNIARYLFAIHSKRIAQYPLVSVDQVRVCGEILFFYPHFWVIRVTSIATAFGPPNFQMEIKWLLLIHSLKKNPPIKIPRSAPGTVYPQCSEHACCIWELWYG